MAERREILEEAWDKAAAATKELEDDRPDTSTGDSPAGDGKVEKSASEPAKAPAKEKAPAAKPEEGKEEGAEESPDKKEARAATEIARQPGQSEGVAPVTDKAPGSWKPAVREHWAKLPPEVREEVNRRELQIQQALSQTAQVRKFSQDFAQAVAPYSHLIRAQNSTPIQAVRNLMQTAAGLMQGSAEQKAQIVAEIIGNYGVDIKTLDGVLSKVVNNPQGQPQAQAAIPAWAQPIFGFMNSVQERQQQREQQLQVEAAQTIESFADKPYFDDLRDDMADLMELAANRGVVMTMEQAYEKAVALRPDISSILSQRKAAQQSSQNAVSQAAATLARARRASSTIAGAPSGKQVGARPAPKTRREALEQAWDDQTS